MHFLFLLALLPVASDMAEASENDCGGFVTFDSTYVITVHETELPQQVRLIQREDTTRSYTKQCYELHIQGSQKDAAIKVMKAEAGSSFRQMYVGDYPGIEFIDVNFDDYLDIKMFNFITPTGASGGFDIYLFDQEKTTFIDSPEFSRVFEGTSFELKEATKEIVSYSSFGGCCQYYWHENTYQIRNGLPYAIIRKEGGDSEDCPSGSFLIEEQLIDGEWKRIGETCS